MLTARDRSREKYSVDVAAIAEIARRLFSDRPMREPTFLYAHGLTLIEHQHRRKRTGARAAAGLTLASQTRGCPRHPSRRTGAVLDPCRCTRAVLRARVSLTWQNRPLAIRRWARTFAGGSLLRGWRS